MSKKNRNQNKAQAETLESNATETPVYYPGTEVQMTETTLEELEELETIEATPEPVKNNFAVAAEKLEAQGIEPVAPITPVVLPTRGVLPDAFGNNVKGTRICSVCGIQESETLAKNPRYSFCKGKCVNCYGKTERKTQMKPSEMTADQIKAKIAYYSDLLAKSNGTQGQPEVNAVENTSVITDDTTISDPDANLVTQDDELAAITF